jgi:murein DD-endopeptidase MepM/ murein hydrolase activator NlpD
LRHLIDGKVEFSVNGHLSQQTVQVGDIVLAGDQVGRSGQTGGVLPHLHFEFREQRGFDVVAREFAGRYFPPTFRALDTAYDSPTRFVRNIDTAYGRSVEDPAYQQWKANLRRQISRHR